MKLAIGSLLGLLVTAGSPALADGMKIEPGKWELRSVSRMPMLPQPQVHESIECITDADMDPSDFMTEATGCRVTGVESSDASLHWTVTCSSPGGEMKGEGDMTSQGDTVHGVLKMAMTAGGQTMTMEHQWEGRRLGDCD